MNDRYKLEDYEKNWEYIPPEKDQEDRYLELKTLWKIEEDREEEERRQGLYKGLYGDC